MQIDVEQGHHIGQIIYQIGPNVVQPCYRESRKIASYFGGLFPTLRIVG